MASSNPNADRLAKSLQLCLSRALGMKELRRLGWFDLLQEDWPQTDSPSRLACDALFRLSVDDHGNWTEQPSVIVGIVTFLKQTTGKFPTSVELKDLKSLLESRPVDRRSVEQWFSMLSAQ